MQIRELLVEYNRQITARQVGLRLIDALKNDRHNVPNTLWPYVTKIEPLTDQEQLELVNEILAVIESKDPTPNKAYTAWLAKMYAKGSVKLEDMNRNDLLTAHHEGKRRRRISAEHADINRFKTYREFEDVMFKHYPQEEDNQDEAADATKFYEDSDVTIVIPHNRAAACKYGRGTRWCTAATRGENQFDYYNNEGPLYIIIPKKPLHPKEKYQLHRETFSFMDELDDPIYFPKVQIRFPKAFDHTRFPTLISNQDPNIIQDKLDKLYKIAIEQVPEAEEYAEKRGYNLRELFTYKRFVDEYLYDEAIDSEDSNEYDIPEVRFINNLFRNFLMTLGLYKISNALPGTLE